MGVAIRCAGGQVDLADAAIRCDEQDDVVRVLGQQQVQELGLFGQHTVRDVVQDALGKLYTAVRIAHDTRFVLDIPGCTACGDDAVVLIPPAKGCGVVVGTLAQDALDVVWVDDVGKGNSPVQQVLGAISPGGHICRDIQDGPS